MEREISQRISALRAAPGSSRDSVAPRGDCHSLTGSSERTISPRYLPLWSEGARALFALKGLDAIGVDFRPGDAPLAVWTGVPNAPVVLLDDEPPASGWEDILALAERLGPDPALVPAALPTRARFFALDLYAAATIATLAPLPDALHPIAPALRPALEYLAPAVAAALTPALRTHRDLVYATHIHDPARRELPEA